MTRNQRSYHAFIRTIKAEKGITHKQAIGAARALKVKLGRTVRGVDVKRHPRLTGAAIKKAIRHGKKTVPAGALKRVARGREYEEYDESGFDEYVLDLTYEGD